MKKIISVMLAVLVCSFSVCVSADGSDDIMPLLSDLKIMVGDDDGNYRLNDKVSRAEFTKVAVSASKTKNTVAQGAKVSPFSDVTYKHWAAPYVRAAVTGGLVEGYIDATFRPDNTVSYEEALTMLLKVLGYTNDDFGFSWPYGQVGLADSLDITKDVDAHIGDELTRAQVARLVYNTLNTKLKDTQTKLLSVFDCEVIKDVTIISSHNEDSSLAENKIFTTSGTYEINDNFSNAYVGRKGDIYIKNGDDFVSFTPNDSDNNGLEKYVIYSNIPNAVIGYKNGGFDEIEITDGTTCYKDGMKSTYSAVKNNLEMGDILYVRKNGTGVDYVSYEKGNMEGPLKVSGSNWNTGFDIDDSTVIMRGGNKASAGDIQNNDIMYYSSDLNMALVYTDKVTGIYEKALPTKDSPTSVTVSGKEYKIESIDAFNELSSSGSFRYGDTVTLLLGRNGEVAGVASGSASPSGAISGFVIETGKKDFTNSENKNYSSYYAKVVSPDGTVNEYATSTNVQSLVCSVVRISFKNGVASITKSRPDDAVSGAVNASRNTIGNTPMAEDIKILDTSGVYTDDTPGYCRVYPQRLDGMTLSSSKVKYYSKNSAGEIDELILSDVTGDTYSYGIVINGENGSYDIDIDGTQRTYMLSMTSSARGPYRFKTNQSGIQSMVALVPYAGRITELTRTEAEIGTQRYLLSDNVTVYKRSMSTYMKIPLDEAINGNYNMTAYYDKAQKSGGRIRIIIAEQ